MDVVYSILIEIAVRPNLSNSVAVAILDDPHVENCVPGPTAADMQPRVLKETLQSLGPRSTAQLEADLERAWAHDPFVLSESAATRRLREQGDRVN